MTKLTRKLLISVFTLVFALVTLGASTFAWFTLSSTAAIDQINMKVVAGDGIEISGDGTNYRNQVPLKEIVDLKTLKNLETVPSLDSVTSADGKLFKNLDDTAAIKGFVEFKLYFRSPTNGAVVYLDDNTTTASTAKTWVPDVSFRYRSVTESNDVVPPATVQIFGADSLRFSVEEYDSGFSTPANTPTVFELSSTSGVNLVLGDTVNVNQGLVRYWSAKTGGKDITSGKTITLPTVKQNADLGVTTVNEVTSVDTPLLSTTKGSGLDGYYYNYAIVRLWLEGWDPDNFDSILNANFSIILSFGISNGLPQKITLSGGTETLAPSGTMQFTASVLPTYADQGITWSVTDTLGNPTTVAEITDGLLTASATETGTVRVVATSTKLNTVVATYDVTIG